MIGAVVIGRCVFKFDGRIPDNLTYLQSYRLDRKILKTNIKGFQVNFFTGGEQKSLIGSHHVLDVEVGPELLAPKYPNLMVHQSMNSQDVDGQIQAQAVGITAHRSRADDGSLKPIRNF